jgi:hypothetical protein
MNVENMFDSFCQIQRLSKPSLGTHNRPVTDRNIVGTYSCRIGKTTGTFTQGSPQGVVSTKPRLYTVAEAYIQSGDIAIVWPVDSTIENITGKYVIDSAYKPGGNHTECDVHRMSEP